MVVTVSLSPIRDNIRLMSLLLHVNLHGCEKKCADFRAKTYIFSYQNNYLDQVYILIRSDTVDV